MAKMDKVKFLSDVEIDSNLKVNDTLIASKPESESIYTWNNPINVTNYPSNFDTPEIWRGEYNASDPYWTVYKVKAGYTYHVGLAEYPGSPSDRYSTVLIYDQVGGNLIGQAEGIAFDNFNFLLGNGTQYIYNGLTFTAPVSGIAYVGSESNGFSVYLDSGVESAPVSGQVKINGDLEVTGDLSFGADSHLVFGTIEGTDFIADQAKVKNAPVEDDDVVNYKTLKDWGPSITKMVKLYETTVSKSDTEGKTVWGHETFAGPDGPYIFEFTTADGRRIIRSHLDFSPAGVTRNLGTIIDEWAVAACSPPVIGSTSYYPVTVHEDAENGWTTFQIDFCGCESFPDDDLFNMRFTIYMQTHIGRDYFDRIGINGDLEIAGNLSINGKRVLTEDDLTNLVAAAYKNANEEVY